MESKSEEVTTEPVVVVLDVETTGLKPDDKVVQIACLKIDKNGDKTAWMRFVNPNMDSQRQQEAYRIHNISPEFLSTKPTFEDVSSSLLGFLQDVDVIACHNALFDWSMLSYEFKRIDASKADDFEKKFQWLDTWRLAVLFMPSLSSHSMKALKSFFNIYHTDSSISNAVDCGGDSWRQGDHDAMYDVFTTFEVLKRCMGTMDFSELLKKYPKALLDTSLFVDIQRLRDENKTTDEDLRPLAFRAKKYYTAVRPKGGVLGDLSKDFLRRMTRYHRDDDRTDRRVVLIYEAALLDPVPDPEKELAPPKEAHNEIDVSPCKNQLERQHLDDRDVANPNLHKVLANQQSPNITTVHNIQSETAHTKEENITREVKKEIFPEETLTKEEEIISKTNPNDYTDSGNDIVNVRDSQEIDGKEKGILDIEEESSSSPKKIKVE